MDVSKSLRPHIAIVGGILEATDVARFLASSTRSSIPSSCVVLSWSLAHRYPPFSKDICLTTSPLLCEPRVGVVMWVNPNAPAKSSHTSPPHIQGISPTRIHGIAQSTESKMTEIMQRYATAISTWAAGPPQISLAHIQIPNKAFVGIPLTLGKICPMQPCGRQTPVSTLLSAAAGCEHFVECRGMRRLLMTSVLYQLLAWRPE